MTDLRAGLSSVLSWWDTAGVDVDLPETSRSTPTKKPPLRKRAAKPAPQNRTDVAPEASPAHTQTPAQDSPDLAALTETAKAAPTREALFKAITDIDAGELSLSASQPVFFRGNPEAKIMVIGEAPGTEEDRAGQPFIGKSGELLDRIFASIGLDEAALYITNVVNFRPPANRKPNTAELDMFTPFIRRHIALIAPDIIVLVGGVSLSVLTEKTGIMKNRGQWLEYDMDGKTIPALPVYHPAFLLRRPELKADMWRDMLSLKARLGD